MLTRTPLYFQHGPLAGTAVGDPSAWELRLGRLGCVLAIVPPPPRGVRVFQAKSQPNYHPGCQWAAALRLRFLLLGLRWYTPGAGH